MRLKEIRKAKGISQKQIAAATGMSQSGICRIEKEQIDPPLSTLKRISAALECSVGELLGEPVPGANDGH